MTTIWSTSSSNRTGLALLTQAQVSDGNRSATNLCTVLVIKDLLSPNSAELTREMISATSLEGASGILIMMSSRILFGRSRSKGGFIGRLDIRQLTEERRLILANSSPLTIVLWAVKRYSQFALPFLLSLKFALDLHGYFRQSKVGILCSRADIGN